MDTQPGPVFFEDGCQEELGFEPAKIPVLIADDAAGLEFWGGGRKDLPDGGTGRLVRHGDIVYHPRAENEGTHSSVG